VEMSSCLMDEQAVRDRITESQRLFEMRSGCLKFARGHQGVTVGEVAQNEPDGIVPPTAQTQQILGQVPCQIEFAAVHVITGLTIGNVKVFHGEIEVLS